MIETVIQRMADIANKLDSAGLHKEADILTQTMLRVAQSPWQMAGDAMQYGGEALANGVANVAQTAYNWLTPQGLAQMSIEALQQQFNGAVNAQVKQQVAAELQKRGVQPGTPAATNGTPAATNGTPAATNGTPAAGGNPVSQWQQHLVKTLGINLPADGQYGPQTQQATMSFQKKYNLIPDGIAGPSTMAVAKELTQYQGGAPYPQ